MSALHTKSRARQRLAVLSNDICSQEEPAAEEQPAEHPAEDAAEDTKDGESEGAEEEAEEEEEPKPEINVRNSFPHHDSPSAALGTLQCMDQSPALKRIRILLGP